MKSLFAVSMLLCSSAFADTKTPAPDMTKMGPTTRKVTKEDKKGIDQLYTTNHQVMMKGDVNAAADLIDFPIHMATDDSKGAYSANDLTREQWVATMTPFMSNMPKDMKMSETHTPHFLSDTLAVVIEENTMTMGKVVSKWVSSSTLVNKGGKWMFKTMSEAGWGDMAAAQQQQHAVGDNQKPPTAAK